MTLQTLRREMKERIRLYQSVCGNPRDRRLQDKGYNDKQLFHFILLLELVHQVLSFVSSHGLARILVLR